MRSTRIVIRAANRRQNHQRPRARGVLSVAVERRVEKLLRRHDEILQELNSAGRNSQALGKELSSLSSLASLCEKRASNEEDERSLQELLEESGSTGDEEFEEELEQLRKAKSELENQIIDAVLPQDEEDYESDAVIEVRAGTGGDEASLFASELLESYVKTAKTQKWKQEILSESKTDLGGIKEASLLVSGRATFQNGPALLGPFGLFQYESGVHRVQRVPVNDSRIHTSACSVAVLPSASEDSNAAAQQLPKAELKIETMRSSGAGGQHVNTTDSAVRITHIPTGITASIQDERSQHKNKDKALKLITARVRDKLRAAEQLERGETRSGLMGGGDRSERIRTYNFPQDRVTDHRSKTSKHGMEVLLNGGPADGIVGTFFPILRAIRREEMLEQIEKEEEEGNRSGQKGKK